MNNEAFLIKIKDAFIKYLETGSRSNQKLKILHGAIAGDLKQLLGEGYKIHSLGVGDNKEALMDGRYMPKKVDIAIEQGGEIIGAIALKFIMRNYSQNSNNYFENMLGETANIRATGKLYFQILILPYKVPYFDKSGQITKIETITEHNLEKYLILSKDKIKDFLHTPDKTLIYLVDLPELPQGVKNIAQYNEYYSKTQIIVKKNSSAYKFGSAVIYNDYEAFINKVAYAVLAI